MLGEVKARVTCTIGRIVANFFFFFWRALILTWKPGTEELGFDQERDDADGLAPLQTAILYTRRLGVRPVILRLRLEVEQTFRDQTANIFVHTNRVEGLSSSALHLSVAATLDAGSGWFSSVAVVASSSLRLWRSLQRSAPQYLPRYPLLDLPKHQRMVQRVHPRDQ